MLMKMRALIDHLGSLLRRHAAFLEIEAVEVASSAHGIGNAKNERITTIISDVLQMSTRACVLEVVDDIVYVRSQDTLHVGDLVRCTLLSPGLGTASYEVVSRRGTSRPLEFGLRKVACKSSYLRAA